MDLKGIHHLTAVTARAADNHRFYTGTLGLRLVKKTVNQDDVSAYHLFYADGQASPGTDITFFDWPVGPETRGTHSICRTGLRVGGADQLEWWAKHLTDAGVKAGAIVMRDGRATLQGGTIRVEADFPGPEDDGWLSIDLEDFPFERNLAPIAHNFVIAF